MAARRLLIVMLILLGISTLAAALIPQGALRDETTTRATTTQRTEPSPAPPAPAGRYFPVEITIGGKKVPVVTCPAPPERKRPCKPIRVGDRLSLSVYSANPAEVEIPAFGLVGVATATAPAIFELLFSSAESYGVKFTATGKIAARIEVLPATGKPKRKRAKPRAREGSGPA